MKRGKEEKRKYFERGKGKKRKEKKVNLGKVYLGPSQFLNQYLIAISFSISQIYILYPLSFILHPCSFFFFFSLFFFFFSLFFPLIFIQKKKKKFFLFQNTLLLILADWSIYFQFCFCFFCSFAEAKTDNLSKNLQICLEWSGKGLVRS